VGGSHHILAGLNISLQIDIKFYELVFGMVGIDCS
jgi:hypothetical protein